MVESFTGFETGTRFQTGAVKFMNDVIGERKVETQSLCGIDHGLGCRLERGLTAVAA